MRELIEAKVKGLPREKPRRFEEPGKVVDLMALLRKSIGEGPARGAVKPAGKAAAGKKRAVNSNQGSLLLPIEGKAKAKEAKTKVAAEGKSQAPARRKRA